MIIKQDVINRVKEYFNLNIYETKVWVALLSKGIGSAGEVAELSGVPRSRTYDVLESLEKRGFAIVKIGKPVKYIAVKPTEVIEKIKSKTMNDAQEKVKSLITLKETPEYNELEQLYKGGINPVKTQDITGIIKGRSNVVSRLRELLENAQKEIFICTSVSDFEDKSRALIPSIEKGLKQGIKIKLALSGEPEKIKQLNLKHNFKAKQIGSTARIYMTDRKEVLFMTTPMNAENSDSEMGVWLDSNFFTDALSGVIENALKAQ